MYLTRSSSILWQILNKTFNYSLKKKDEQRFIYLQLELLDRQYCLEKDQELWQSYLDIGLQQGIWPVSFSFQKSFLHIILFLSLFTIKDQLYTMAKTTDFDVCKKYLMNYIKNIKKQFNQCQFELIKHSQSCPIRTLSFDQIQYCLKEFVDRERKYLSTRHNDQLIKFKDDIHEKELFKTISTYFSKTNGQVNLDRV